ncbi:MAG: hydantoinase B/oxoprolinase family protein [Deltaproteobacteria bacterium]|nr:hydantoinase B/oxoprolinase family protein [Deltaproteobacteria bacterium]
MELPCAEIYEAGLWLPAARSYQNVEPIESVPQIIAAGVRAPDDVLGDLDAGVTACGRTVKV